MPFASRESRRLQFPTTVDGRNPKQPPGMVLKPCKEWDKLPTSTGFPNSWTINGMILCVDCFKPLVPSRLLWENVDVAIPDTHPWDWYIYLHEWLVFMVKCREIYQSNGLFGIFFWFRFANHNPHTRPNVSMLCTMKEWAMEAQLDHRFSKPTVY